MDDEDYYVIKEFQAGMEAAMFVHGFRNTERSTHWLKGFDAGYRMRVEKNAKTDEYLISIGREPQRKVKLA
jgi:hypothetical protein